MSSKLLVICGPTATGKTSLAVNLAQKFDGEIISADSRQVYKSMDIGTGKEWGNVPIYGYDLVDPKSDFSVSQYLKFAQKILTDIWRRQKLPILAGGTGLYVKGIIDGIATADIPRNTELRAKLEGKSIADLYENLSQLDAVRAGSMNTSDKKNPRRLIRAIEIATWKLEHGDTSHAYTPHLRHPTSLLMIGLTAPKKKLDERIAARVKFRVKLGIKKEIEKLLRLGVTWDAQSMQALGYKQWRDYFEGGVPEGMVVSEWIREEQRYAKRQMMWFKKDKRINWFDISESDYPKNVESLVRKWYSIPDAKKN